MSSLTSRTSDLLTANTLIRTGRGVLSGAILLANGTDAAFLTVFDGLTASGKVIAEVNVAATLTYEQLDMASRPIVFEVGCFAAVSGTGAEFIVYTG